MSLMQPGDAAGQLVEMLEEQPGLFENLDLSTATVKGAKEYLHTGSTTSRDNATAAMIIAASALGWSNRLIAERMGHSRNTVAAVLRLAEKNQKLEPLQERVRALALEAVHGDIELGNDLAEKMRGNLDSDKADRMLGALAALRRAAWVGVKELGAASTAAGLGAGAAFNVSVNVGAVQVVQEYAAKLKAISDLESGDITQMAEAIGDVCLRVRPDGPETGVEASGGADAARGREGRGGGSRASGGAGGAEPSDQGDIL